METIITRHSDEFEEFTAEVQAMRRAVNAMIVTCRPPILSEIYLTGEEVCRTFHISKRALQNYRDR